MKALNWLYIGLRQDAKEIPVRTSSWLRYTGLVKRTNREVVEAFWCEVWSEGRADLLPELFAESATENGEPLDVNSFQRAVVRWREIFDPFEARIEELLEHSHDRVISRVTYIATQVQSWAGLPGSGKTCSVPGIDLFRLKDGLIVELWHSADHLDLMQQLGGKIVSASSD